MPQKAPTTGPAARHRRTGRHGPRRRLRLLAAAATTLVSLLAAAAAVAPPTSASGATSAELDPGVAAADPPTGIDAVIPRPVGWSGTDGSVRLHDRSRLLVDPASRAETMLPAGVAEFPGPVSQPTQDLAALLQTEVAEVTGLTLPVTRAVKHPRPGDILVRLVDDPALGAEGYRWDSSAGTIVIEAATTNGLYYGSRTLLQLLEADPGHRDVAAGTATDVPTQAVRMVQLDAGRRYWSMDYLEDLVRRMGQLKLNTLFLHLSESEGFRLDSPRFPGLADPDSSYDRGDIERLKALGAQHHVQIMGGIDVPGHATHLSETFGIGMGSGENACTGAHTHSHLTANWIIDMTSDAAVEKTKEIVTEFAGWFDAPLFSIGADELPGQLASCPKVQQAIAADPELDTLGDMLSRYINGLDEAVTATGARTAIFSGIENMDSPRQDVNASVVHLTWENDSAEPEIPGHDEIAIGPFYLTPNNYHNLYPDVPWIYETWAPSTAPDMLGSGMPSWADYNFWADDLYFEDLMVLGRAALADRAWNGSAAPDTVADFTRRVEALADPVGTRPRPETPRVDDGAPSHHWTFDDAEYPDGWTWAGSPGNTIMVEDVAGDLPGTSYIINNPAVVPDGVTGEAFRFDHRRDGVGFGGVDVAEPWTVSTWVNLSADTPEQVLLASKDGALKLRQAGTGKVGFTEFGVADHSFEFTLPSARWVQLTWVATPGETTLYADGQRVGTVAASIPLPLRSIGTPSASLVGDLDELVTWDEALSAEQVAGHFAGYERPAWDFEPTVASLNSHETPQWFHDDKFGIFIHWGAYSVPAWGPRGSYAEWYWNYQNNPGSPTNTYHRDTFGADAVYDDFIGQWQAENFDPESWVRLFEDAGANYFVLTSKHHEGVALYDSPVSGRDTVNLGPGRDLAGELFAAAREHTDLRAGFYYSLYEWFNPSYTGQPARNPYTGAEVPYTGAPAVADYVGDYMLPQMRELIDQYDPDILWCDGQWEKPASYWQVAPVLADFYNGAKNRPEPKDVVVANRCKIQSGALDSLELDFQTPEYTVKPDIDPNKWESSRGIAHSYGYNRNEPVEDYLTSDELVDSLADIVSKNGNLLLNVGPQADGTIPELQEQRLRDIGAWLDVNGEAIYGTTYFNRAEEPASSVPIRYTVKDGTLYATALEWPGDTLTLGGDLPFGDDTRVTLLGSDGTPLSWSRTGDGTVEVRMPAEGAATTSSEHAFVFAISTPGVDALPRTTLAAPSEIPAGGSATVSATVTNPSSHPTGAGDLAIAAPEGWTVEPSTHDLPSLQPGESYTVPVALTVPDGAASTEYDLSATTTADGLTTAAHATVTVAVPNLSRGKPAEQVSLAWNGVPERAVDGNRDGVYGGNSVTHTAEPSNQAWWQVDLGVQADIETVEIYNRTDCCAARLSDFWVMVSPEPITTDSLEEARTAPGVTAVHVAGTAGRPSVIELPEGTQGRHVRVQLESAADPLSLAEVEVRGFPAGGS
ncbi:alpha-L-fucosidase [Jiangella gansuensis]|uniref:alpha-L-fucosidase n=1 Tax=Jiangella gansuensis TaxID=281473 RepID=UPI0004B6E0A8|nr:alpha-L-fucosidase [Jiangella gansuensis]